ncbi:MAG: FAD-dependent oxidoreductase, partial [Anaerolineae bacterium]|nr:FAD-dependent oxidoreductase [Anaerolineae bacterium]
MTRSWKLPDIKPFPDEDLGTYLTRIGFTADQLQYARRSFVNAAGDAIRYFSAEAALAEMQDISCGEGDFRIADGYDTLTDHLAQGLDVRLNTVVREIEWSGDGVRVTVEN